MKATITINMLVTMRTSCNNMCSHFVLTQEEYLDSHHMLDQRIVNSSSRTRQMYSIVIGLKRSMYMCVYVCVCVCVCVCAYVCMHACVHACIHIHVCMRLSCVHVYMHAHIQLYMHATVVINIQEG